MSILKILFFSILNFSFSVFSFNFFPHQNFMHDFFWHLKTPNLDILSFQRENRGFGVRIAILDTVFHENQKIQDSLVDKICNLNPEFDFERNLRLAPEFFISDEDDGVVQNNSLNLKFDTVFSGQLLKKNHGAYAVSLIRQIAPKVEIVSIPIFNDRAETSKINFLHGLRQALDKKVHILYVGLKMDNFDKNNLTDRAILQLLHRFDYVIAPSGNNGAISSTIAFPAKYLFFSVGAFEKKNDQYLICDFSQSQFKKGPCFVMPGKDLLCFLWNAKNQKCMPCFVSGTSMAAALMVGCLANLLSAGGLNFTPKQMQYLIQKNSIILDPKQWQNKVIFGTINMPASVLCVQELVKLKMQILDKKFKRMFEKFTDEIVRKLRD